MIKVTQNNKVAEAGLQRALDAQGEFGIYNMVGINYVGGNLKAEEPN